MRQMLIKIEPTIEIEVFLKLKIVESVYKPSMTMDIILASN